MLKMKTPYRILKLKSGEQIIAKLKGEERGKIIIERPMVFMTRIVMDPYSGRQRELTVLKNWLAHTNEIETRLPKDYIATYLVPDSDVMELYGLEKEKEDVDTKEPKITNLTELMKKDMENKKIGEDMMPEDIENLIDMMKDAIDENPDLLDDIDEMEDKHHKNFITMSLMLPPEALMTLVESGIIEEEDILNLIDNINGSFKKNKPKYTGDDEKRQKEDDFGNIWTDWSADLDDYLE